MKTILFLHALAGGISLIAGFIAIISKKGQQLHIKSGLVYYWAMMAVVVTGLLLGIYKTNVFILTIAIFSFYMVFTGRRILSSKKEINPKLLDWFFNILSLLIALFMISRTPANSPFTMVCELGPILYTLFSFKPNMVLVELIKEVSRPKWNMIAEFVCSLCYAFPRLV